MKRWIYSAVAAGICVAAGFMALTARDIGPPTWIVGGLITSSSSKSPSSFNQMTSSSNPFDTKFTRKTDAPLNIYDVPQGQVGEVLARLKHRADQGEALASLGTYQNLNECKQLPNQGMDDGLATAHEKASHWGYQDLVDRGSISGVDPAPTKPR